MKYFIREIVAESGLKRTAGVKARDDMESILTSLSIKPIDILSYSEIRKQLNGIKKYKYHYDIKNIWHKQLSNVKPGDYLYIQFPIIEHSIFLAPFIKKLERKNIKIILIIHDLELLRAAKRKETPKGRRIRLHLEEENILKASSYIIVHNDKMKEYVKDINIDITKVISLEIFDYLVPNLNLDKDRLKKDSPIIIAGNLRPHKAQYVYHLPNNSSFNLYGVDYEGPVSDKINYFGSFPPDELPKVLKGSFGLVWDGEVSTTCSGVYGEYLKINNPHKTSLYLALGIPVIIWKKAALADFILNNKCGIVVDSLWDIKDKIDDLSEDEYANLVMNARKISQNLLSGYYTKKAINQIY